MLKEMTIIVTDKLRPSCVLLVHLHRHIKILLFLDPPPQKDADAVTPKFSLLKLSICNDLTHFIALGVSQGCNFLSFHVFMLN